MMTKITRLPAVLILGILSTASTTTTVAALDHGDDHPTTNTAAEDGGVVVQDKRNLQDVSPLWDPSETRESYVHFPDAMKELLDAEFHTLMRSPQLGVFTTVPEPDQRVWPLVKGMMLRNHLDNKILWAHPNYLITDGLEYGCREMVDGAEQHTPVESTLCDDHCLHQGRYCAPFQPSAMPDVLPAGFKGKELVKESLRRLCFDHYYHASDVKYFEYLEGFDRKQCLQQDDVTQCSMEVIIEVDHADYSNMAGCVNETSWEMDVESERLELQLKEGKKAGATLEQMPIVKIGNVLHERPAQGLDFSTEGIFKQYCNSFGDKPMHPVSCDVCGPCQNVRHCLWTLECDGQPFDPDTFLKEHAGENGIPELENDKPAETEQPTTSPTSSTTERPVATLPPGGVAQGLSSDTTASSSNVESQYEQEEEKSEKTGVIMLMIIIVVAALIVGFITYRDRRTKFLMAEIHAEQMARGTGYRDDESIYVDYVDDTMRSDGGDDDVELSQRGNNNSSGPPKRAFLPEMT